MKNHKATIKIPINTPMRSSNGVGCHILTPEAVKEATGNDEGIVEFDLSQDQYEKLKESMTVYSTYEVVTRQPEAIADKILEHGRRALQEEATMKEYILTRPFPITIEEAWDKKKLASLFIDMRNNNITGTIRAFLCDSDGNRVSNYSKPIDTTRLPDIHKFKETQFEWEDGPILEADKQYILKWIVTEEDTMQNKFPLNTEKIKDLSTKSSLDDCFKGVIDKADSFYLAYDKSDKQFFIYTNNDACLCTMPEIDPKAELMDDSMTDFIINNCPPQDSLDKLDTALADTEADCVEMLEDGKRLIDYKTTGKEPPLGSVARGVSIYNKLVEADAPDAIKQNYMSNLIERAGDKQK